MLKQNIIFSRVICTLLLVLGSYVAIAQPKAAFSADVVEGCTPLVVKFTDESTGNPASWKWDLGNGILSSQQHPGAIYINPGSYSIKLVTTNNNGQDSVVKIKYINVYGLPEVSFNATPTIGCAPLTVKFSDNSNPVSGTIAGVIWDFGDGEISKELNPSHVYRFSDTFNVALTVSNSYGCKKTLLKKDLIMVPVGVKSKFEYTYFNVCQPPAQVDFKNQSTSSSYLTHSWDFGDGTTSDQVNPSHTFTAGGAFKVKLVSKTEYGCLDTFVQVVSIGSVKADFSVPEGACTGQPLVFKNTSNPAPIAVNWVFSDGFTSKAINVNHTFSLPGVYNVVMAADFGNCNSVVSKVVTVTNKPKAAFTTTGNLSSCSLPHTVNFVNASTGATSYKWLFGDGQITTLANPAHTYTSAGIFSVSLIAYNSNGCSDTLIIQDLVHTIPPKITGFPGLPFRGCAPYAVDFKANINSSEPIVSYLWNFGDGETSPLETPSHLYSDTGSYNVKLNITSVGGCKDSLILMRAVELGKIPTAKFFAKPLSICPATPAYFYDESEGNVTEWLWFFGDGTSSPFQNPDHQYYDTGYFDVTLVAKNSSCSDTLSLKKYIQVFPPIAKFSAVLDCKLPYLRKFIDKSVGAKTWEWDFGDGELSNEQSPLHTYAKTGKYTVSLKVTNGDCEFIKTDTVAIVDESPSFIYSPVNSAYCKNDPITFTATDYHLDAISTLSWNFGNGVTKQVGGGVPVISYQYPGAGNYNPFLIATDVNGCKDTVDQQLSIAIYGPTASFANISGTCINNKVIFNDKSYSDGIHPIQSWTWNYGDGTIESKDSGPFEHTYTAQGSYTVQLVVIDSLGCKDVLSRSKAINVAQPLAKFSESDTLVCSKNVIAFNSLSTSMTQLSYRWDFGDGQSAKEARPTHNYGDTGTYTVKLSIVDMYGCRDSVIKYNHITISNPDASFILNDTIGLCPPLLIEPNNISHNYSSLNWDFGDNSNTNIVNPQHYYSIPGEYELRLVVKGYGNCYDTASKKILLKGPSGTLNYTKNSGCAPTEITFSSTARNVVEFIWDFNNGVVKHTTDTIVKYNYKDHGSYLPKLVLVDSAGCKVSVENKKRIIISDITAGIKQVKDHSKLYCDSSFFSFYDSSGVYNDEITAYSWSFGDNQTQSSKNPTHFYYKNGVYNVKLFVATKNGCTDSITIPVPVTIKRSPKVGISVIDSVCQTSPVKFFVTNQTNDNAAITWNWSFGDGGKDNSQNAVYTYSNGGTYTANLLATSSNGCTDKKTIPVTVHKNPVFDAGADSMVCYGNAIILKASGAYKYSWKAHASLSCTNCSNPIAKPDSSARYFVTATSNVGCKSSDSVFVKVYHPFKVKASGTGVLCMGQTTTLNASGSETYQWSPQTYLDNPFTAHPTVKPTAPANITYTVTGKDSRNCFMDTASVTMKIYPVPSLQIIQKNITANAGFPVKIETISSPDITYWKWTPALGLDSPYIGSPTATPKNNITYQVVATNEGNCNVTEEITLTVTCDGKNVFVPNTFSPNNDGMNDMFFPRGKGVFGIKSFRVFNRWGNMVFEKVNFNVNSPSEGWNGLFQGKPQAMDVYVYMMEVVCDNGTINKINGNVTLLR